MITFLVDAFVSSVGKRRFDDDLLLEESDRTLAAKNYPSVFHVLDHPGTSANYFTSMSRQPSAQSAPVR